VGGSDAVDRTELALSPSPLARSEQVRGKPQLVGHEHGHQPTSVAWVHHVAQERQTPALQRVPLPYTWSAHPRRPRRILQGNPTAPLRAVATTARIRTFGPTSDRTDRGACSRLRRRLHKVAGAEVAAGGPAPEPSIWAASPAPCSQLKPHRWITRVRGRSRSNATIFGRSRMNLDSNGARPADWSADSGSPAEASMWCHTLSPAARRLRHHAGE
jgi:hypothetical protein